jgi:hypothetical protein
MAYKQAIFFDFVGSHRPLFTASARPETPGFSQCRYDPALAKLAESSTLFSMQKFSVRYNGYGGVHSVSQCASKRGRV